MLLAVDIGNSSIKFGVFDDKKLTVKTSIPTKRDQAADEIFRQLDSIVTQAVDSAIVCSVVPEAERAVAEFVAVTFGTEAVFVGPSDDLGLSANFDVRGTGVDRLVNSFAAAEIHGTPCIVVSLGTATTVDAVNSKREYLGGLIAAGLNASAKALSLAAPRLPEVEIKMPEALIARTTEEAIRSGIVYGHAAMVDGLVSRILDEAFTAGEKPLVVATGGHAAMIAQTARLVSVVDTDLTLKGLQLYFERRRVKA